MYFYINGINTAVRDIGKPGLGAAKPPCLFSALSSELIQAQLLHLTDWLLETI